MTLAILFVLFLLVIGAGLFVEPALARRRRVHSLTTRMRRLGGWTQQALKDALTPNQKKLVPDFKRWIKGSLPQNDPLGEWLLNLPEEAIEALTGQLMAFCRELNFELVWLLRGEIDPETHQRLEQIVISYCRSCLKAVELQPDIVAFRNYARFMDGVSDQQQAASHLLERLNEQGLVDSPSPDLLSGSVDERLAYVRHAIRTATRRDRVAVKSVLNEYWR